MIADQKAAKKDGEFKNAIENITHGFVAFAHD
jgi:hypothetical protein